MLKLILLASVIAGWIGSGVIQPGDATVQPASGASEDTWEEVTVVFTMDATVGHLDPQHDADVAAADVVVDLTAVSSFAYGYPSLGDADGYHNGPFGNYQVPERHPTNPAASLNIEVNSPSGVLAGIDRAMPIFHIPYEDYIPANSTIVSATVTPTFYGSTYFAQSDTAMAVLMTNPNDDEWYKAANKGITVNYPNYSYASWDNQVSSNSSDPNWAGANSDAWNPTFAARTYFWDMGDYWDWTGGMGNQTVDTPYAISIKNCVQAVANGAVNNGIALLGGDVNTEEQDWDTLVWDEFNQSVNKYPWVTVKYLTKSYQLPFGTGDWALVVSTDDGRNAANTAWVDVAVAHDAKFTIAVNDSFIRRHLIGGVAARAETLLWWHDVHGMEIANHTLTHPSPRGLATYLVTTDTVTSNVNYNKIRIQASPEWMYSMADSIDGNERRNSPYWGKSAALPNNKWNPEALRILADMKYSQVRVGSVSSPIVHSDYDAGYFNVDEGTAFSRSDSLFAGASYPDQRKSRNMMGLPTTMPVQLIVGEKTNTTITEAQVKQNMKRAVAQIVGDGRGVLSLFWHETKPLSGAYSEGVDAEEFDWMLDVMDDMGGRAMRMSEYGNWIKQYATAIDRPAALDTFGYLAADAVWFVPDGVDQTWIRGVK
jgi:peptidoglycan/xylan/chitin deacetylase (PgdA/CDA1 family)